MTSRSFASSWRGCRRRSAADVIAVDHQKQSVVEISARLQSPGAFLPVEVAALAS
ncbi:MAG TPA: hypothetical protein VM822_03025 [Pseudolabrys sp.]|nr:hypothetical protein [Pseudolabrys sp.]